jgi:branched-chain amino acid transport system substrate-binding protein
MRAWSLGVVVVVVLALAGCTGGGNDVDQAGQVGETEVRIGVLAPLSGAGSATGQETVRGAQLAAEMVNDGTLAGLSGAKLPPGTRISVVTGDTKGDADTSVENAVRLIDDERVAALVAAGSPEVMAATSERTERLGVPFIGADPTADFLTERGLAWFFRTGPTERALGATLFSVLRQQAAKNEAAARIAIAYPTGKDTGKEAADLAALLSELAGEGGFQLATMVATDLDATDQALIAEPVTKIASANPGAVFLVATSVAEARQLVRRFRTLSGPVAILGFGEGFTDPIFQTTAGRDAAGLLYPTAWSYTLADRSPTVKPILKSYSDRHGRQMSEAAANGFTAVQGIAEAVARVRSADPGQLRTALLGLDLAGRSTIMPWEGIRFDASGQNVQASGIVEQRVLGTTKVVFPPGLADAGAVPLSKAGR